GLQGSRANERRLAGKVLARISRNAAARFLAGEQGNNSFRSVVVWRFERDYLVRPKLAADDAQGALRFFVFGIAYDGQFLHGAEMEVERELHLAAADWPLRHQAATELQGAPSLFLEIAVARQFRQSQQPRRRHRITRRGGIVEHVLGSRD